MSYLALDIGNKRTGIAKADSQSLVPVSLETYSGKLSNLINVVLPQLIEQHTVTDLIVGMPLLPSGIKGKQSRLVTQALARIRNSIPSLVNIHTIDERYTSKGQQDTADTDATSALQILQMFLETHL